jgi:hypothetical protein
MSQLIPPTIVNKIQNLKLSKKDKCNCLNFIHLMIYYSTINHQSIFDYVEIPTDVIKNKINHHYNRWMKVILESGLLVRDFYEVGVKSYSYRLNPILLLNYFDNLFGSNSSYNFSACYYKNNAASKAIASKAIASKANASNINIYKFIKPYPLCFSLFEKWKSKSKIDTKYQEWFSKDFQKLNIEFDNLNQVLETRLLQVEDEIKDEVVNKPQPNINYRVLGIGNDYYSNSNLLGSQLVKKAKELNFKIIQTKKGVYLDDLRRFTIKRMISVYIADNMSLEMIKSGYLMASRNKTNNRLDTNITNLPSEYCNSIMKSNDMIQIDLSNSQFCFLSWWLSKYQNSDDFILFQNLSYEGKLYNYIQREFGLTSREKTKRILFYIFFSSNEINNSKKELLRKMFPTVIDWVEDYKSKNNHKTFCIELQRLESNFFIDNIYETLKKLGYVCFTKHDSVIVESKYKDEVINLIQDEMGKIGMGGDFK